MSPLATRLSIGVAVLAVLILAQPTYGRLTAASRLAAPLAGAVADPASRSNILIRLNFTPEPFHVKKLQELGTVAGIDGDAVRMIQVSGATVRRIASYPWVQMVEPLK